MVDITGFTSAGLAGSEEMSRFLWDSGVAALPCDNPSVEVTSVPLNVAGAVGSPANAVAIL